MHKENNLRGLVRAQTRGSKAIQAITEAQFNGPDKQTPEAWLTDEPVRVRHTPGAPAHA